MTAAHRDEIARIAVADDVVLRVRLAGDPSAPPLLLLHGYPQTHAMWRRVAERLAPGFRLVMPDLRGYGESSKPAAAAAPAPAHAAMSKRALAADTEEMPEETARHLRAFFGGRASGTAAVSSRPRP